MLLLALGATARLTRLVTTDTLTERPRAALLALIAQPRRIRRSVGPGVVIPPPTRLRAALVTLLQCPWCISFWIACAVLAAAHAATLHPWAHTATALLAAALTLSYFTGWLADNEAGQDVMPGEE